MKKTLLFAALLAFGAITFSSCTEEEPLPAPTLEEVESDGGDDENEKDDTKPELG